MLLHLDRVEQVQRLLRHASTGGIQTDDLAAGLVLPTANIADLGVTAAKIAADAVTTAKILDANVTTAKIAAGGATLPKVSFSGLKVLGAAGKNGAGAITLTGAAVGDRVIAVFGAPTAGGALVAPASGVFEAAITVVDQVQQVLASNLSANTYIFLLAPAAA